MGYSQYGRLVSPFPPGGLKNGATIKKACPNRKNIGTGNQALKGLGI